MEKNPKTQVTKFEPETIFATSYEDIRGSIYSITGGSHNKLHKLESKLDLNFFHTKIVRNKPGVFRGFHADGKSWKKCTCLEGEVKAIIIDPREIYKHIICKQSNKSQRNTQQALSIQI